VRRSTRAPLDRGDGVIAGNKTETIPQLALRGSAGVLISQQSAVAGTEFDAVAYGLCDG
jgi:hypothetical protein